MSKDKYTEPFNQDEAEILSDTAAGPEADNSPEADTLPDVPVGEEGSFQRTPGDETYAGTFADKEGSGTFMNIPADETNTGTIVGEDAAPDTVMSRPSDGIVSDDRKSSEDDAFSDADSDSAEDALYGAGGEPADDVFTALDSDSAEDALYGAGGEPADDVLSGTGSEPADDVFSGADSEPADDVLSGTGSESEETSPSDGESEPPRPKRKKRYIIPLILVAIFAVSVAAAYQYANALNRPRIAVADFLDAAAKLDFEKVESMTQSGDMSVLTDADVQLPVFHDFFLKNNQKLTYKVSNTKLNLGAGTSQVTMHLHYLDNTDVYRQALSELLRQVVEHNLSEDISTNTEMQQTILSLLREKSAELDEKFMETDVVYNLIKVDGEWKVVSMDRETLRAISSNCVSIQDEIDRLQSGDSASVENRHLSDETSGSFNLDTDDYSISYASHEVSTDYAGNPCLLLYYDYTNKSDYASGALMDVSITVFQHGRECPAAIPAENINETDSYLKSVAPGKSARICQAFALEDLSDVTVQSYEGLHLAEGNIHSVVIHLEEKKS